MLCLSLKLGEALRITLEHAFERLIRKEWLKIRLRPQSVRVWGRRVHQMNSCIPSVNAVSSVHGFKHTTRNIKNNPAVGYAIFHSLQQKVARPTSGLPREHYWCLGARVLACYIYQIQCLHSHVACYRARLVEQTKLQALN